MSKSIVWKILFNPIELCNAGYFNETGLYQILD